jgi:hypothetical protein
MKTGNVVNRNSAPNCERTDIRAIVARLTRQNIYGVWLLTSPYRRRSSFAVPIEPGYEYVNLPSLFVEQRLCNSIDTANVVRQVARAVDELIGGFEQNNLEIDKFGAKHDRSCASSDATACEFEMWPRCNPLGTQVKRSTESFGLSSGLEPMVLAVVVTKNAQLQENRR